LVGRNHIKFIFYVPLERLEFIEAACQFPILYSTNALLSTPCFFAIAFTVDPLLAVKGFEYSFSATKEGVAPLTV
jgi:hypothetical protein